MIAYSSLFSKPVFVHARLLLAGAILAPGKRTVTSALRVLGLSEETKFHKYHRVLSLARWCALEGAHVLLGQLLAAFLAAGPVVVGIDETIERRWGSKINKRGIYRDSARSSRAHFVKCSGLRWISLMLLLPMSWAGRVWALPFLTVLAPSERYAQEARKRHKKITDWARQMLLQLKRWLPERQVIAVGDSSYAVMELLAAVRSHVTFITRLRLDAALYEPAPARVPGKPGRSRKKGERLPSLQEVLKCAATKWQKVKLTNWYGHGEKEMEIATGTAVWYHSGKPVVPLRWVLLGDPEGKLTPVALLSTDLELPAETIVLYFARRWSVEVTLEETRAHIGVETQRQWSDKAIERTTPVLLGLFSIVTLLAERLQKQGMLLVDTAAWHKKEKPTFSDAIAAVRRLLWQKIDFSTSDKQTEMVKIPKPLLQHFQHMLANAA
ncbi:transposase [Pontibacter rugosus]|uniref:Transposase n=1 Tax=Pontibacter rugosus TaxID=1745966 RepID=A0ABW3SV72_9BACT